MPSPNHITERGTSANDPSGQQKLLARVDQLSAALASTTLSVSELVAVNHSLDAASAIVQHGEYDQRTANGAVVRPSPKESRDGIAVAMGEDAGTGSEDLIARVSHLVLEMQRRADESRYITRNALHKASAAKEKISRLEAEFDRL